MKSSLKYFFIIVLFFSSLSWSQTDRELWVGELTKMAEPVLKALSNDELVKKMPVKQGSFEYGDRSRFASLEAFGRLMAGLAPWLELGVDNTKEGQLREKFIKLSLRSIENAVNPDSTDFMNFNDGSQALVDTAFLAQAFLRAPTQLWEPLSNVTKQQIIKAFKSSRLITPYYNNWLLFSATIEAFFMKFANSADEMRIDYAIKKHLEWYVGDGLYADGENYHWDYYNSFVIQPMMLDILNVLQEKKGKREKELYEKVLKRSQRYAIILERLISPEGTYPIIGRSTVYRLGAFQTLSQMCLLDKLPKQITYGQVRAGLTAVLKRLFQTKNTFDKDNWLNLGVVGYQPNMAEPYICTGSLYLTSVGFLHLGLPETHAFWTSKSEPWTMKKMWDGDSTLKRDKYINK